VVYLAVSRPEYNSKVDEFTSRKTLQEKMARDQAGGSVRTLRNLEEQELMSKLITWIINWIRELYAGRGEEFDLPGDWERPTI